MKSHKGVLQTIAEQVTLKDYLVDILGYNLARLNVNISCPIHTDNKPSLRLYYPADRNGYCFSCGKAYTSVSMHRALNAESIQETISFFKLRFSLNLSQLSKEPSHYINHAKIALKVSQIAYNHITDKEPLIARVNNFLKLESWLHSQINKKS